MPRYETHLTEFDIRKALVFWVKAGCPVVDDPWDVKLTVDLDENNIPSILGPVISAVVPFQRGPDGKIND